MFQPTHRHSSPTCKYQCATHDYFGFGRLCCLLPWGGQLQKIKNKINKNLVLNTARAEDSYARRVQMVLFQFGKKKHLKKKKKVWWGGFAVIFHLNTSFKFDGL